MPPLQILDLISPAHWFEPDPGRPSDYYIGLALLLTIGAVVSAYFSFFHTRRRYADHALKRRVFGRFGQGFAALFVVGLAMVGIRYLEVIYLSARVLVYLDLLGVLGLAGFAAFYTTQRFPPRLAEYDAEALRRSYFPRPGAGKGSKTRKRKKDQR